MNLTNLRGNPKLVGATLEFVTASGKFTESLSTQVKGMRTEMQSCQGRCWILLEHRKGSWIVESESEHITQGARTRWKKRKQGRGEYRENKLVQNIAQKKLRQVGRTAKDETSRQYSRVDLSVECEISSHKKNVADESVKRQIALTRNIVSH